MSLETWADNVRRGEYRQAPEHQGAIDVIKTLLEGTIDSDRAATVIASMYNPLLERGFKLSPVPTLWAIICDIIRALGGNTDIAKRLIYLLNSISKLPDVMNDHDNATTPVRGRYWRDLPDLAIMFRENAIDAEPIDDEIEDEDDRNAQAVPLLNATTFGAMYLAQGRQPLGMPFHAEVSLMHGIEVPCETLEQQRRAVVYVPPAATWILLAGEVIYELCKNDHDRKDGAPGSTSYGDEWLWGQGRGYSLGRWALWKKRFGEIGSIKELKDGVTDIAAKAAVEMERVEG